MPRLPLLMASSSVKKKPARVKKELEKIKKETIAKETDVVITTRAKKTWRDDDEFNKEKDVVITKKDVVITEKAMDETTQYCGYCGASRVQPGAVRCEACGIYN